jgi:hypothetical protein
MTVMVIPMGVATGGASAPESTDSFERNSRTRYKEWLSRVSSIAILMNIQLNAKIIDRSLGRTYILLSDMLTLEQDFHIPKEIA